MSGRRIFAAIFVVVSIVGMWLRYQNDKAEKRKREDMLRSLASISRQTEYGLAQPTPVEKVDEPRDMFDSALPREYLDEIKSAVGQECKLLDVYFHESVVSTKISTDGESAKEYRRLKTQKGVQGPREVQLVGSGTLKENLFDFGLVNLSLIPKLTKEAKERASLADSKVTTARFNFPMLRYEGEGPEWTVTVEASRDGKWEHKFVTFDAKGKFKKVL
jgi:hypothetical protein